MNNYSCYEYFSFFHQNFQIYFFESIIYQHLNYGKTKTDTFKFLCGVMEHEGE